jgi:hypothetical protein
LHFTVYIHSCSATKNSKKKEFLQYIIIPFHVYGLVNYFPTLYVREILFERNDLFLNLVLKSEVLWITEWWPGMTSKKLATMFYETLYNG